jgi:hypothetical protein
VRVAGKAIYVQIDIRAPLDRVWQLTQTPELHRLWDLRFSDIQYLPRPDPAAPQQFLYQSRIGFGIQIHGHGESIGSHEDRAGQRSSALKFWSDDRKSLIREGSGYWKYIPLERNLSDECDSSRVRFLTGYDYDVRFGAAGRLFDRVVFRPLIGWATAWSFDRLRLWMETGADPAALMRRTWVHAIARWAVALVWIYQGAVPKLLVRHGDEWNMLRAAGLSDFAARVAQTTAGWAEIIFGLILLWSWRSRWPLWVTVVLMPFALLAVGLSSPRFLVAAFNPVSLNASVLALAAIAILSADGLPSAANCVRKPSEGKS